MKERLKGELLAKLDAKGGMDTLLTQVETERKSGVQPGDTHPRIDWIIPIIEARGELIGRKPGDPDMYDMKCPHFDKHSMDSGPSQTALHIGGSQAPYVKCLHGNDLCQNLKLPGYVEHLGVADRFYKRYERTDTGNARRYADTYERRLRFVMPDGDCLAWNETTWEPNANHLPVHLMTEMTEEMLQEALRMLPLDSEERKKAVLWAFKSQDVKRICGAVKLARHDPRLVVPRSRFNQDRDHLITPGGVIGLKDTIWREARLEDYDTRITAATFDINARCPLFESTLERLLPDASLRRHFQRLIGYAVTGHTREKLIAMLYGPTNSGKTLILQAIAEVLGSYATSARPELLLSKRENPIPHELAELEGKRLVYISETDEGRRLDVALVKAMTGRDTINARFLHKRLFSYSAQFTVFLATNHKPVIRETGDAIWGRLRLIPFSVTIPEAEQDKELPEKLAAEKDGILNWILEGARLWYAEGLQAPEAVTQATQEYRDEMDLIQTFIAERCTTTEQAGEPVSCRANFLHEQYVAWCKPHGEIPMGQRLFAQALERAGYAKRRDKHSAIWMGLRPLTHGELHDIPGKPLG